MIHPRRTTLATVENPAAATATDQRQGSSGFRSTAGHSALRWKTFSGSSRPLTLAGIILVGYRR